MRSFLTAMAILAILTGSGIAFDLCLNNTSERLLESCERIGNDVEEDNFENAYDCAEELSEYIDGKKPLLSSILDHGNIDEIEKQISELLGYTEKKDKINAAVSIKKLKHMLEHLPENYELALQNIL